jgi:hypothetical protein
MAAAEGLKAVHQVDNKVEAVDDKVQIINGKMKDVGDHVQQVDDRVLGLDDKVQQVSDDMGYQKRSTSNQLPIEHRGLRSLTGDQLRKDLRNWLSPPDPSVNYNLASDAHHEGTALWFIESNAFKTWKTSSSLLWIYGKRMFSSLCCLL